MFIILINKIYCRLLYVDYLKLCKIYAASEIPDNNGF